MTSLVIFKSNDTQGINVFISNLQHSFYKIGHIYQKQLLLTQIAVFYENGNFFIKITSFCNKITSFYKKNYIHHSCKKLPTSNIRFYKKTRSFGNKRDPWLVYFMVTHEGLTYVVTPSKISWILENLNSTCDMVNASLGHLCNHFLLCRQCGAPLMYKIILSWKGGKLKMKV